MEGAIEQERHILETDFFADLIDYPASKVLDQIEASGVKGLSDAQRLTWARFVISLPARTPEAVLAFGPTLAKRHLDAEPASYLASRQPNDPLTLSEWAERNQPGALRNWVRKMLSEVISETPMVHELARMDWWVRRLSGATLLVGDRPLLSTTNQGIPCAFNATDRRALIALPLSPTSVMFMTHNPVVRKRLRVLDHRTIAANVNADTLRKSVEYVYASDSKLERVVRSRWPILRQKGDVASPSAAPRHP
jgi:hypothetical protein